MAIQTYEKIDLISQALVMLGEVPLDSLASPRKGAQTASALFEILYENELQSNRWRFAMNKVTLSRLVGTPLNQYQYSFQLPADMLLPVGVWPIVPYEIYGTHLYSNSTSLDLEYMFKPAVNQLPAYFALLMTYGLARDMCVAITGSESKLTAFESVYKIQRNRAMYNDAQGRPAIPIIDSPFTDIRF